jgi:hypothetical protein
MWKNNKKVNNEKEIKGEDTKDLKTARVYVF